MSNSKKDIICKNCEFRFHGKYCPNCSQKAGTGRLKVSNVSHELWHSFTHTDKGFLALAKDMVVHPGMVIREYLQGKRKKYFNPYTFYLLVTALNIFIVRLVYQYEDKKLGIRNEFGQWIGEHSNIIVLCAMPFMALWLILIYVNKRINYAESVTLLFFAIGIANLFRCLLNLLYFPLISYHHDTRLWVDVIAYVFIFYVLVSWDGRRKLYNILQAFVAAGVLFFIQMYAQSWALQYWEL